MKFKSGEKVKIVANESFHMFDIGQEVVIEDTFISKSGISYYSVGRWYLNENEIAKIKGEDEMKTHMTEEEKAFIRKQVLAERPIDMLEDIFQAQQELDQYIFEKHPEKLPDGLSEWVIKNTIAMESEIDEIRSEVNWKWWKAEKQIDIGKLRGEVIDLWHFLIQLSQRVGLTPDMLYKAYMEKREENFKRQDGTSTEKDYRDK